jgi:DNA modification methylase
MDCLEGMKLLDDNSIDCIVTSPPYYMLRDYNVKGQIGLEKTIDEYLDKILQITNECKRVLKKTGTLFWNHGDGYAGNNSRASNGGRAGYENEREGIFKINDVPVKSLLMTPYRLAIRMIDEQGWILRNQIIWHKPNCMPSSVKDRFTVDFEPVFFFTKSKKYFFNQLFESRKTKKFDDRLSQHRAWDSDPLLERGKGSNSIMKYNPQGRNKRCVWNIKYEGIEQETKMRQGMNRERGNNIIEKRDLPKQKEFVDKLREHFTIDELLQKTKLPKTHIEHWFRYDECGFSYPTKEDWKKVKTDLFPELLKVYYDTDDIRPNTDGRNKRCVWKITTKPFKEAHFAVYPEDLVSPMIEAGCPEFICKKCGKAREVILEKQLNIKQSDRVKCKMKKKAGQKIQEVNTAPTENLVEQYKKVGYSDCGCNAGWKNGIVLDPFAGSGTTGLVARKLLRNFIGFEINPTYCAMANKRINSYSEREVIE